MTLITLFSAPKPFTNPHIAMIQRNAIRSWTLLPDVEVILLGGRLYKYAQVTVGAETLEQVRQVRADLCLLGVCSLHPEVGISLQDFEESRIQRAMADNSAEVAALASAEKIGTAAPFVVGGLDLLNYIVTSGDLSEEELAPYRQFHLEIL